MFRWTIVQEARKKKESDTEITDKELNSVKKDKSNNEAEGDDIEANDYTEDIEDDSDSDSQEVNLDDEDLDASDYTEGTEEDFDGNSDSEETNEAEGDDIEANDYTEDGGNSEDESDTDIDSDEEQTDSEETVNEDENQLKNSNLINDYIELYDSIKTIISRVSSMNKTDLLKNRIIIQVSKNLNILLNTIYKYIIESFEKNTYVFNMYQFNLFIEAVNINIQMLKKSSELVSKK